MWTAHCDVLQDHHSLTDREVRYLERRWLKEVFKAKEYLKTLQYRPPILVDPAPLRSRAEHLASHRRLAHRVRHVLAWTLNEVSRKVAPQGDTYGSHLGSQMVEDLTSLADAVRRDSLFPHQALRVGSLFCVCLSLESECYGNMALQDYLPSLIERLRDRDRAFILMDPRKKKILFKLLALRSWIGDRPIRHLPLAVAEAVAEGRSLPRISSPLDKQVSWISHCGSHTVTLTRSPPYAVPGLAVTKSGRNGHHFSNYHSRNKRNDSQPPCCGYQRNYPGLGRKEVWLRVIRLCRPGAVAKDVQQLVRPPHTPIITLRLKRLIQGIWAKWQQLSAGSICHESVTNTLVSLVCLSIIIRLTTFVLGIKCTNLSP